MKARSILFAGLVAASMLAWNVTPTEGAVLLLGGQEGTEDPPDPTDGAETEEDWNPTVTCSVTPPQNIMDLLECLLDEISNPPPPCNPIGVPDPVTDVVGGDNPNTNYEVHLELDRGGGDDDCYPYPQERSDFVVTLLPLPHYGVEIRTLDDGEIERLSLRENDPGIQTTELEMEPRAGRVARIHEIDEAPAGGRVVLTINGQELELSTRRAPTSVEVTADLLRALRSRGFQVHYEAPYVWVGHAVRGIYKVQFRSTDPGITKSDLSLFPPEMAPAFDEPALEGPALDEPVVSPLP